ncbi:MAG TPA: hypothetical protein VGR56_08690, partial [Nitrososphaerales archaeon]|nr:hypothetical protein [Nitrososphaerales archaeon]
MVSQALYLPESGNGYLVNSGIWCDASRWTGHGDLLGKFLPRSRTHGVKRRDPRGSAPEQKRDPAHHAM